MKERFYFTHDFNARSDPKLQAVLVELGAAGLGIFWCIIEQLYEQDGVLPLKICKSIAFAMHVDVQTVESLINDFGLFENDGENFWSRSVNERLENRRDLTEKRKGAAAKRWQSAPECNCNANAMQMQCKCNALAMQNDAIKEKENKKENKKEKDSLPDGSESIARAREKTPARTEVKDFVKTEGLGVDPDRFFDYNEARGWRVNGAQIVDWRAALRSWATTCPDDSRGTTAAGRRGRPPKTDMEFLREAEKRRADDATRAATQGPPVKPDEWRRRRGLAPDEPLFGAVIHMAPPAASRAV